MSLPDIGDLIQTVIGPAVINDILPTSDPETSIYVVTLHDGSCRTLSINFINIQRVTIH